MIKNIKKDTEFEKMKWILQSILDKHSPSNKQISVKNLNKEQIRYFCRLLLENNDEKRIIIMNEIGQKYKKDKYEFYNEYLEILKHKEIFNNHMNIIKSTDWLLDDMEAENEVTKKLNDI